MLNKTLLGSAAVIMTMVGAQAADLPSKKAAPATYVKICDAQGAGFFFIPGTETCVKLGGYVRVDYDYRPERKDTYGVGQNSVNMTASTVTNPYTGKVYAVANGTDSTTSGFYNRGTIQLDARTPTSMGVARSFMALRLETGGGLQAKSSTQPSVEAAFVQWAGFTAGQAAMPAAFMSSWAYNTAYWGGWPSGVRQLTYTAVLGGGFSATVGVTDMKAYDAVATKKSDPSAAFTQGAYDSVSTPGYNGLVYVGNVRYDQAWGAVQVFGAAHTGGDLTSAGSSTTPATTVTADGLTKKGGYAIGLGVAFNLPMLAAGDRIEATAVYNDRLQNIIGDKGINTPSSAAYGSSPVGGPAVSFANGTGWVVGAQMRHYWTAEWRTQIYGSYTARTQHDTFTSAGVAVLGGTGNAYSLGGAMIYSPAKDFDIGLEMQYLRVSYDKLAVNSIAAASGYANGAATTPYTTLATGYATNNLVTKLRVQRNF